MVTWRQPPALIVPVAAIGLTLLGWVTLSLAQYRGIAPSDLLVMACLYAAQARLEATLTLALTLTLTLALPLALALTLTLTLILTLPRPAWRRCTPPGSSCRPACS